MGCCCPKAIEEPVQQPKVAQPSSQNNAPLVMETIGLDPKARAGAGAAPKLQLSKGAQAALAMVAEPTKAEEKRESISANAVSMSESDNLCVVCMVNEKDAIYLDCGHRCVCMDCTEQFPKPMLCPMCRNEVRKVIPRRAVTKQQESGFSVIKNTDELREIEDEYTKEKEAETAVAQAQLQDLIGMGVISQDDLETAMAIEFARSGSSRTLLAASASASLIGPNQTPIRPRWACQACTFLNASGTTACEVCQTQRPL